MLAHKFDMPSLCAQIKRQLFGGSADAPEPVGVRRLPFEHSLTSPKPPSLSACAPVSKLEILANTATASTVRTSLVLCGLQRLVCAETTLVFNLVLNI
jgi:hypothetical protein